MRHFGTHPWPHIQLADVAFSYGQRGPIELCESTGPSLSFLVGYVFFGGFHVTQLFSSIMSACNINTFFKLLCYDYSQIPNKEHHPILRKEVEAAVKALNMGKSAGVNNIPAELVPAGEEAMIDILTLICNKISKTGKWPTTRTQTLVITLPKKCNLQLCQKYRTISLSAILVKSC